MKSSFYVATVTNAYRRALDAIARGEFDAELTAELEAELSKASHREYTTGFYFGEQSSRQYYPSSKALETYKFIAVVKSVNFDGTVTIEQRNKFAIGDVLETLSVTDGTNKTFTVTDCRDEQGRTVEVANRVQQLLTINCPHNLSAGDILRSRNSATASGEIADIK